MCPKKLGWNIKMLREMRGISGKRIADRLGMSESGYSKIERGEIRISLEKPELIAAEPDLTITTIMEFNPAGQFRPDHGKNTERGAENNKFKSD